MRYAKIVKATLYASSDYGAITDDGTWNMYVGFFEDGEIYVSPSYLFSIGGVNMSKQDRNRVMFFGSWTGEAYTAEAEANVGDSTGVTKAVVAVETFSSGVGGISGEYTFLYDGENWKLNGNNISNISTAYGITLTGEPASGDIVVVIYRAASGAWEALGKDNDDLSKELNPDTETTKNVLGETQMTHSGYEPEVSVDPYYIDPSRKMYKHLREIALEELSSESDCLGYFAEAYFTAANREKRTMTGYAYVRRAWYVPQSVGGDTSGFAIPVTITPIGPITKKKIVYDMATNEATITDLE